MPSAATTLLRSPRFLEPAPGRIYSGRYCAGRATPGPYSVRPSNCSGFLLRHYCCSTNQFPRPQKPSRPAQTPAHTYLPFLRTAHSTLPRWWAVAGWPLLALVVLQFAIRVLFAVLDKSGERTDDIIGFSALSLIAISFASWWFWFSRRLS
jgi:hypothetical protein